MNRTLLVSFLLTLLIPISGCGPGSPVSIDVVIGRPTGKPDADDPPYDGLVVFPSGLRVALVQNGVLTASYPAPDQNPFGSTRARHYARVGYFLPLDAVPLSSKVSANFRMSEYVTFTLQQGGHHAYVDPQIAWHAQEVRSGLGQPVILSSAYRSPEHNQSVGGSSYSRHQYGDAVDIDVDQNRSDANTVAQEVFNEALDVGVDFVQPIAETSVTVNGAFRASWVHLDDRGF